MNGTDLNSEISLSQWTRDDLKLWRVALPVNNRGKISNPDIKYRPNTVRIYTFSAGGSLEYTGRGIGAVIFPNIWS